VNDTDGEGGAADRRLAAWRVWAGRVLTTDPAGIEQAARAALVTVEAGGSSDAAAVAAHTALGVPAPPPALAALDRQRWRAGELLTELDRIEDRLGGEPGGPLRAELTRQLATADTVALSAARLVPSWPPAGPGPVPGAGPPVPPPVWAGPAETTPGEPRDQGVQILGATGAFLLVAATILFEAYGVPHTGGVPRFLGVLALETVLALATAVSRRLPRLRPRSTWPPPPSSSPSSSWPPPSSSTSAATA
jgi:hypothetical protein